MSWPVTRSSGAQAALLAGLAALALMCGLVSVPLRANAVYTASARILGDLEGLGDGEPWGTGALRPPAVLPEELGAAFEVAKESCPTVLSWNRSLRLLTAPAKDGSLEAAKIPSQDQVMDFDEGRPGARRRPSVTSVSRPEGPVQGDSLGNRVHMEWSDSGEDSGSCWYCKCGIDLALGSAFFTWVGGTLLDCCSVLLPALLCLVAVIYAGLNFGALPFLLGSSIHISSLGSNFLFFGCLYTLLGNAEAVTCSSCHDQIPGCAGGTHCPLFTRVAENAAILVGTTGAALSLKDLLPIKFLRFLTRGFLEAAKVMANRSAPGTAVDWDSLSMVEVSRAPARGIGTRADAIGVLQERVGAATEAIDVARAQALISSLQQSSNESKPSRKDTSGAVLGSYTFFLAEASKIVEFYSSLSAASLDLEEDDSAAGSSGARKLKGVIRHPKRELDFFFLLLVWSMILVSVGMETFLTVAAFLVANAYDHMLLRKWDWRITYFYFVILLERVETSGDADLNISTVSTRLGGLDTLREEATLRAEEHYGRCIFRPSPNPRPRERPEEPPPDPKPVVAWNNKSTPSAEQTCHAFNLGPAGRHGKSHLLADGTCKFCHKCDKFVSDKGPGGRCLGDHPRDKCTNPARIHEAQA